MPRRWVKKELQRNPVGEGVGKALGWVLENKENVGIGMLVIIILAIFVPVIVSHQIKMNNQAFRILFEGENQFYRDKHSKALKTFRSVYKDHKNTDAAPFAIFYEGCLQYKKGDYENAVSSFKKYLQDYENRPMTPQVLACMGSAYEQTGDYSEAVKIYRRFIDDFSSNYMAPSIYQALARLHLEMGQEQEALGIYKEIDRLYNSHIWAELADYHIERLGGNEENPEPESLIESHNRPIGKP